MDLALYAHPWDLRALSDHGGLARLRDLGYADLALAVSYHAGRWLTPWDPAGLVRFLEDGTVHFRPRADYGLLAPLRSRDVPPAGPSPLQQLCEEAKACGMRARAWTVFTHNTRLGEQHPELCVENALGDRYPYALCPSQPHVQRYQQAMVRDLAAHPGLDAIELEAIGWMGWKHSSHHEKASFAPDALTEWLLSLCWCTACIHDFREASHVRAAVAQVLRQLFAEGDAMVPASVASKRSGSTFSALLPQAGDPLHERLGERDLQLLWQRFDRRLAVERLVAGASSTVRAAAAAAALPAPRLALQVHPNEFFHGSQAPASARYGMVLGARAEVVLTCYGSGPDAIGKALAALPRPAGGDCALRLCIHPKAPEFQSDDDLRRVRALCEQHGVAAISIYHLGLLPWRTIERAAAILRT